MSQTSLVAGDTTARARRSATPAAGGGGAGGLREVSLTAVPGAIHAVIGPNGAGKRGRHGPPCRPWSGRPGIGAMPYRRM